jgi:phosphoribosylamine--glycine ligase
VKWSEEASACVVLAARGYPERPETGARIEGLEGAAGVEGVEIFHAGTARADDGSVVTAGGRVLGVSALGDDIADARTRAYAAVELIAFDGMQRRTDIAAAAAQVEV